MNYKRMTAVEALKRELAYINNRQEEISDGMGSVLTAFRYEYQILERRKLVIEESLEFMRELTFNRIGV